MGRLSAAKATAGMDTTKPTRRVRRFMVFPFNEGTGGTPASQGLKYCIFSSIVLRRVARPEPSKGVGIVQALHALRKASGRATRYNSLEIHHAHQDQTLERPGRAGR